MNIDLMYRSEIPDECIELAVQWWVDQLSEERELGNALKTSDRLPEGPQRKLTLSLLLRGKPITPEQLETFKTALTLGLKHTHPRAGVWGCFTTGNVWLYVDYEPQGVLLEACKEAKINPFKFPSKTKMDVNYKFLAVRNDDGEQVLWGALPVPQDVPP